ncbi:MAG: 4Fe-4S binding protein [Labilithrix sp.]|nr:4Fe-4S binding protein [Labilithrix sp.]
MPFVIAEPCESTCETACVDVCPVDAIHGPRSLAEIRGAPSGERRGLRLYIDPEACTSCSACASQCPVEAIFDEDDLPPEWAAYAEINAAFFAATSRSDRSS